MNCSFGCTGTSALHLLGGGLHGWQALVLFLQESTQAWNRSAPAAYTVWLCSKDLPVIMP